MADKNLELALKIRADLKQAVQQLHELTGAVDEANSATRQTSSAGRTAAAGITALGTSASQSGAKTKAAAGDINTFGTSARRNLDQATTAARQYDAALNDASRSQRQLGGGLTAVASSVKAVVLTAAAGFGLAEIVRTTDAWTAYENRLRLVTHSQQALTIASQDVYQIARNTSQQLDATAAVYQRFSQNADRLGISQKQVASFTDTVSKAVAVSGASAASAEAALVQFGQALASGVLRGEEFNSVSEQTPALLMAIADGLGVNIGQLRAMANAGELTADVLVDALTKAQASVNQQFETRVKTIAQAATELDTAFTRLLGTLSSGQGFGQGMATAITALADVLDMLSDNAEILGVALDVALALGAGKAVAALAGLSAEALKNVAASKAAATAAAQKALADEGAAVAAKRAALAELEKSRAAVVSAEAEVAATAAEARRTAALAAGSAGLGTRTVLEQAATAAASAHTAAQARLATVLEARALASAQAATATATLTSATAASAAAASAAAAASSLLMRALTTVTAVGSRLLAFLGGPLGLIFSLGLVATAFIDFGGDAESAMNRAAAATESASVRIRNASREIVQSLRLGEVSKASFDQLGAGITSLEGQLRDAEAIRDRVQTLVDGDVPYEGSLDLPGLDTANERVRALTGAIERLKREQAGERFEGVRAGQDYLDKLQQQGERLEHLTDQEQALAFLRKNGIAQSSELGKSILAQADANARLAARNRENAEAERNARAATDEARRSTEARTQAQLDFVAQLERTAHTQGLLPAQLRELELAEQGLTGALLERARAANAAIAAQERLNLLTGVAGRVLALTSQPVEARALQLEQEFGQMLQRMRAQSDTEGVQLVEGLINLELAQTRLNQFQEHIDGVLSRTSRIEQSIANQREAGLITELDAREQLIELHRRTTGVLQEQRPLLEELTAMPGAVGEAAQVALEQLDLELQRLQATLGLMQQTLQEGLTQGLTQALTGLASGTMTLRDALRALISAVAQSMIQLGAQLAAQAAIKAIFGGGAGEAPQLMAAAGALTGASFALDTSGVTLITAAASLQAAAAALAAANVSGSLFGFAEGGYTGPGGKYQPAGIVHAGEYVQPQRVMQQPGALAFMEAFRHQGMAALHHFRGYADGGLVGPASLSPPPSAGAPAEGTPLQINNLLDPDDLAQAVTTAPGFRRGLINVIRAEKSQLNTILGGGA